MGLFDINQPKSRMAERLAPMLEKHTGYVSPQRQLRRAVSQTDLSDSDSVQKTFQMLMQKNPQDAVQWLNSIKPIITANIEQEKLRLQGMTKPRERKIIKDAQGRQRYVDTGALVFPGVSGKPPEAPKQQDLPQMTVGEETRVGDLVDQAFDFGVFDITGEKTEVDKKTITDFVFSYSQINNVAPSAVIKGLLNGSISLNTPVSGQQTSGQYQGGYDSSSVATFGPKATK